VFVDVCGHEFSQAANLLVGGHARIKKRVMVFRPAPLIITVVQENKETHLFGNNVIGNTTGPQRSAMMFEKIVPFVLFATK